MQVVKLVGFSKGTSKQGSPYTVIHVVSQFDDYMTQRGSQGCKAENLYVQGNLSLEIGKEYQLVYGVGFGGKAIVTGVNLVK